MFHGVFTSFKKENLCSQEAFTWTLTPVLQNVLTSKDTSLSMYGTRTIVLEGLGISVCTFPFWTDVVSGPTHQCLNHAFQKMKTELSLSGMHLFTSVLFFFSGSQIESSATYLLARGMNMRSQNPLVIRISLPLYISKCNTSISSIWKITVCFSTAWGSWVQNLGSLTTRKQEWTSCLWTISKQYRLFWAKNVAQHWIACSISPWAPSQHHVSWTKPQLQLRSYNWRDRIVTVTFSDRQWLKKPHV